MFLALRLLGAEVMAVEFGPTPSEEKTLEAGSGGLLEYGFHHAESDVILKKNENGDTSCR